MFFVCTKKIETFLRLKCGMEKRPNLKLRRKFYHQDKDETEHGKDFKFLNRSEETLKIGDYWEKAQVEAVAAKIHIFEDQWQSSIHHQLRQGGNHPEGAFMITRDKSKNV